MLGSIGSIYSAMLKQNPYRQEYQQLAGILPESGFAKPFIAYEMGKTSSLASEYDQAIEGQLNNFLTKMAELEQAKNQREAGKFLLESWKTIYETGANRYFDYINSGKPPEEASKLVAEEINQIAQQTGIPVPPMLGVAFNPVTKEAKFMAVVDKTPSGDLVTKHIMISQNGMFERDPASGQWKPYTGAGIPVKDYAELQSKWVDLGDKMYNPITGETMKKGVSPDAAIKASAEKQPSASLYSQATDMVLARWKDIAKANLRQNPKFAKYDDVSIEQFFSSIDMFGNTKPDLSKIMTFLTPEQRAQMQAEIQAAQRKLKTGATPAEAAFSYTHSNIPTPSPQASSQASTQGKVTMKYNPQTNSVVVFDPSSGKTQSIPVGSDGTFIWQGIKYKVSKQ